MPMQVQEQINDYIASQAVPKRDDLRTLHNCIRKAYPGAALWFLDGKNEQGKVVSNPNIGYGVRSMHYANGSVSDFYQVGMSANTGGISVYILGLTDKAYLKATYGDKIGKATVTGYCIKFKALKDINISVLMAAIQDGFDAP